MAPNAYNVIVCRVLAYMYKCLKGHAANGYKNRQQELRQGYKRSLACLNLQCEESSHCFLIGDVIIFNIVNQACITVCFWVLAKGLMDERKWVKYCFV